MRYYSILSACLTLSTLTGQGVTHTNNDQGIKRVIHIGVDDGLTQGSNYGIMQDHIGFMWFTSNEGLNRYDGYEVKTYRHNLTDSTSLKGNYTNGIVEDAHGNIWIGSDQVLNHYQRKKDAFNFVYSQNPTGTTTPSVNFPFYADSTEVWYINNIEGILAYDFLNKKKRTINSTFKYNRTNYNINSIFRSLDGSIWLKLETGIVNLDPHSKQTKYYFSSHPSNISGDPTKLVAFLESSSGKIWMGSHDHLITRDTGEEEFNLNPFPQGINSTISDIAEDSRGLLWIGTEQDGLFTMDQEGRIIDKYSAHSTGTKRLRNNSAGSIYIDAQDLVWVNVDPEGINVIIPDYKHFNSYTSNLFQENEFLSGGVRNFAERSDGKIWIATQKDGVILFDPTSETITSVIQHDDQALIDNNESYVFIDNQKRTWVGTYNGFYYFDYNGSSIQRITNKAHKQSYSSSNYIWNLLQAPDGDYIFSTEAGVFQMDEIELEPKILFGPDKSTGQIYLNEEDELLLITEYNKGLHVINYSEWKTKSPNKWSKQFLTEFNIKCILKDSISETYWLGTSNGLLHVFPSAQWQSIDSIDSFGFNDGLPSSYIYGALPDDSDRLWLSTNRGLASIDLRNYQIESYGIEDGVQGHEFNTNSFMKASTGELYFGGTNGFNRFYPESINKNPNTPLNVQILNIQTMNEDHKEINYKGSLKKVILPYSQNTFSISYGAIDHLSSGTNRYKVQLEGYDPSWLEMEQDRSVRYTGIPEGQYTFYVKADNGDGIWTKENYNIEISISPPWYRTTWAYCIWIFSILSITYWLYKFQLTKKIAHQETLRLQELDKSKTDFLNKITHDFRTPLTIINNELDNIQKHHSSKETIRKNGNYLLQLVNSILSINKKKSIFSKDKLIQSDVADYIASILLPFESMARSQEKIFEVDIVAQSVLTDFHPETLQRVVYNLIDNAFKHTIEKDKIIVQLTIQPNDTWSLTVTDSGAGIPKDKLEHITNLYYHSGDDGYGIGLYVVSEYVQNMNGNLTIKSKLGVGSEFKLQFPITNNAPQTGITSKTQLEKAQTNHNIILPKTENSDKNLILVVEDNYDLRNQLVTMLSSDYEVVNAEDGIQALDQVKLLVPDLIISDIMMPHMDGIQLLNRIRKLEVYKHIPCILLTAKASHEDMISGLSSGANAYLNKPFDQQELLLSVQNLLQLLRNQQEKNLNGMVAEVSRTQTSTSNSKHDLLRNINRLLSEHLSDSEFRVSDISVILNTNHTSLNKQLKLLTGVTLSSYLRKTRMTKAKKLLSTTDMSVNEVCYQVGISDPAYFTKLYKKEFNILPSEVRKG